MIELDQDVLGELQAELARAADVGDRLDLGAGHRFPPREMSPPTNGRPARNASVARQPEHGRPDAAIGDRGRLDPFAVPADPNGRAKGGDVHFLALGDLVELDDLVGVPGAGSARG